MDDGPWTTGLQGPAEAAIGAFENCHAADEPSAIYTMNAEEKSELDALCKQIVAEQDHQRFLSLVMELNELLERTDQRMQRDPSSQQAPD